MAQNPDDQAAKRYWAEWLIRTNRSKEALAYLENPSNFPGGKDEGTKRMLAAALFDRGDRARAMELLKQSPDDDLLKLLLINYTANPVDREKMAQDAVGKYENSGLLRIAQGEFLLADNKPEEAARVYWNAFEYSRVADQARAGFLRLGAGVVRQGPR